MLLPMDELTAISPLPALATITDVSKSGTLVPAANTVSPMMPSGMPRMRPMVVAHHTMKYEYTPNQQMLDTNEKAHHDCHRFLRTSGTVKYSEYIMGADITYITRPFKFSGKVKSMPSLSSSFSFSDASTRVSRRCFDCSKNLDDLYHAINSALEI